MSLIETRGLTKHFPVESGLLSQAFSDSVVHAVDDVDLRVEAGTTLGLVGESGCGKSTLARTILRLTEPTSGEIYFDGEEITDRSQRSLRSLRSEMQIVFQDPRGSLNPRRTVGEILRKAITFHGIASGTAAYEKVAGTLESVGLDPSAANKYPHEFSGGQQQRIGLARALSVDPSFIVLDEPTSALDVSVQARILSLIDDLQDRLDLTVVFISHDLNVVRHVCDEVAVMYLGKVVERASTAELFDKPFHPYTQGLLESVSLPDPRVRDLEPSITGDPPSAINPPTGCRFHTRCPDVMPECRETPPELVERRGNGRTRTTACHLYDTL